MLYSRKNDNELDIELFKNPTKEYRGTPFWSWNGKLCKDELTEQIKVFKKMGFGGYHAHARTGLDTEYLGKEFMECIRHCTEVGEEEDMLTWLYDEDRWPSGYAGGLVTRNPEHRARYLMLVSSEIEAAVDFDEAFHTGKPYYVGAFDIEVDNGFMSDYKCISKNEAAKGIKKYAYICTPNTDPWYNNQTYANTLSCETMEEFVRLTHQRYKAVVGDKFSKSIPAIFCDEPQFTLKIPLDNAESEKFARLPWSMDFEEIFKNTYGYSISDKIPELFFDRENGVSKVRYDYHNHVAERFATALADTCGNWCEKNNIMLTGHMADEDTLRGQNNYSGDAMRGFRSFQVPGIDTLMNRIMFTTAKQAQSASHQFGREGVLSELYGVTNWDFDFRGHKFQGDWQAAMGVTVRVPHLSMLTMAGEAKRDYPASIGYQSPWYEKYGYIEDHFARVNTALVRGKPIIDAAVIHPIESYWLYFGTNEKTMNKRRELDNMFQNTANWLVEGLIDFEYINEALLDSLEVEIGKQLKVGKMSYRAVVVAGCVTLRSKTLEILRRFAEAGGKVIFAGEKPQYIDALEKRDEFITNAKEIPFEKEAILESLKGLRRVEIVNEDGSRTDNLVHCLRKDVDCQWLFIAHSKEPEDKDTVNPQNVTISVSGEFDAIVYDTLSGDTFSVETSKKNGITEINYTLYAYDSLLLKLVSKSEHIEPKKKKSKKTKVLTLTDSVEYRRAEPNVLLLDYAEYKLDDGEWQPKEEILRLDNKCREKLGFPLRCQAFEQPWAVTKEPVCHKIQLKFSFYSDIALENTMLALEEAEITKITLNGENVANKTCGYFADKDIKTVKLPIIKKGENELMLTLPFAKHTNVENCFILGDFGVNVEGENIKFTTKEEKITFGDITKQCMPFYGGNLTYIFEIETEKDGIQISAPHYRGSLISVSIDGEEKGVIVFDPYILNVDCLEKGKHRVELTLYGNRHNTFGGLHNANEKDIWYGPNYWRTTDEKWTDCYRLKPTGILIKPTIFE